MVEKLADAAADHDIAEREGEEDLMERVVGKPVDRRGFFVFHCRNGGGGGGGR